MSSYQFAGAERSKLRESQARSPLIGAQGNSRRLEKPPTPAIGAVTTAPAPSATEAEIEWKKRFIGDETRRLREVYQRRQQVWVRRGHSDFDPFERCIIQEREELLVNIFCKLGWTSLAGLRILDLGCGNGMLLRHLFDFGAQPEKCYGVDVLDTRLRKAKHLGPSANFLAANGAELPFASNTFDLALQFTVFTSVLTSRLKHAMAAEILRTLRQGGRFVWYDFAYNNPHNKNVRGIGRREIEKLLPGCRLHFWRVTLAPPIGRPAARIHPFLYRVLSELRVFRSHYMCVAEKL